MPLAHHAEHRVVHNEHDDGQVVGLHGDKLVEVHVEAAVAREEENALVGMRHLRADSRAHAEAHGAHAAGGEQGLFALDLSKLRDPHLVLAYVGGDDVAVGFELVDRLDEFVGEGIVGIRL